MNAERRRQIGAVVGEIEAVTARMSDVWVRIEQIAKEERSGATRDVIRRALSGIEGLDFDVITEALDEAAGRDVLRARPTRSKRPVHISPAT